MKKLYAVLISLFLCIPVFSLDFEVSLLPSFDMHLNDDFDNSFSGALSFDFYPFTLRTRDKLGFSVQAGIADVKALTLKDTPLYSGDLALTYSFRVIDRLSLSAQAFGGLWLFPGVEEKNTSSLSGILYGARLYADFYALPELKVGVFTGYSNYVYNQDSFAKKVELGLGFKYSFSHGIFAKNYVEIDDAFLEPIFPVFYSYYSDNSFGSLILFNDEDTKITDVQVYVLIPEYMTNPKLCGEFPVVEFGEYFTVELTAFLNETILETLSAHKTEGRLIVKYKKLGKTITSEQNVDFTSLNRNAMNWDDNRKVASFVSSHDGAANKISRFAKSVIINNPQNDYTQNMSYARGIFATLKAYGLSYVKDPTSPFSSGENADVDFLQFPYQTLLYSGGDCDDLSILYCAIFESIGIDTAFITVPGHIFMAFDAGISPDLAASAIKSGRYIIMDGVVWIPFEATVCQEKIETAYLAGYNQWNRSAKNKEAQLYPVKDAWKVYKAVSIPDSDADIELPSVDKVLKLLR